MKIYKYSDTSDYSFENLMNGELWFNNPSNFKDINDSNLRITENEFNTFCKKSIEYLESIPNKKLQSLTPPKGFFEKLKTKKPSENFLELFNEFKNYFVGITCFSGSNDIPRMWNEYAFENSGFCICFETNFDNNFFNGLTEVNYVVKLPIVDLTSENFENGLIEFYSTKCTKDYGFEEEQRLIKMNQGLFKYNKTCVEEIILGSRISNSDKNKIINLVKEHYGDSIFVTQN